MTNDERNPNDKARNSKVPASDPEFVHSSFVIRPSSFPTDLLIRRSIRCFAFGLVGSIPLCGLASAGLAIRLQRQVARETRERCDLSLVQLSWACGLVLIWLFFQSDSPFAAVGTALILLALQAHLLRRQYLACIPMTTARSPFTPALSPSEGEREKSSLAPARCGNPPLLRGGEGRGEWAPLSAMRSSPGEIKGWAVSAQSGDRPVARGEDAGAPRNPARHLLYWGLGLAYAGCALSAVIVMAGFRIFNP